MKNMILSLALASTMAFAGGDVEYVPAAEVKVIEADKDFYIGGSVQTVLSDRVEFLDAQSALNDAAYGIGIQGGYTFLKYQDFTTSIEGRYTYSWADRTLGDTGVLSGFIKPAYDFGPVTAYGLVGFSEVDVDILGTSDGFAWGLGLSKAVNSDWDAFIDYTVNPDFEEGFAFDTFDNEVVTVGLNYKF